MNITLGLRGQNCLLQDFPAASEPAAGYFSVCIYDRQRKIEISDSRCVLVHTKFTGRWVVLEKWAESRTMAKDK